MKRHFERSMVMSEIYTFDDFLATVEDKDQEFVRGVHKELTALGCRADVKAAKSGYVVSYLANKKTAANYVFRKKGLIMRIYANHIAEYMDILDTFPDTMTETIRKAPVCKRLLNPADCNQRCQMGYDFIMKGERFQKCRNGAFLFLLTEESKPFVEALVLREVQEAVKP